MRGLPEATASQRQLHEMEVGIVTTDVFPVRACGMEAAGEPQHRTQVNPRKAGLIWVTMLANRTPCIWSGSERYWGRRRRDIAHPYPKRSPEVHAGGRAFEGNDVCPMLVEKSDHLIVALKPGNAGGAKGVTG